MIVVVQHILMIYLFHEQSIQIIVNKYVLPKHHEQIKPKISIKINLNKIVIFFVTWLILSVVLTTSTPVLILLLHNHVLIRFSSSLRSEQNVENDLSDSLINVVSLSPSLIITFPKWRIPDKRRNIDIWILFSIPIYY